jgi:hypothetical protein
MMTQADACGNGSLLRETRSGQRKSKQERRTLYRHEMEIYACARH